ncbi:Sec-independent protein translocase protein TatB [Aestuariivirga sp.]|uniref:Sec-independent protein translocase protein TatB n=1 Tax=Aestuariivirga sp. TaxID=2650926 RepID=UPI0025BBDEBE|nr:Sec-independent protein translocase protein TatB [Aestuariivirga sp.]MCA3556367.1 twin-arginine translocase subunit TatB [Aestuariivirga sp.]
MFDFGFGYSEMFVIAVVAIIVIGPKDLPKVLRAFGKTVARMRGMAREFQGHLDQAMKETGFDEVKKEFDNVRNQANFIDPAVAKKAAEDSTQKQVDDFKKLFGEVPAADAAKPNAPATTATPAAS